MTERDYTYKVTAEGCDLNESEYLKPYGYQRLFAIVAEEHSKNIGVDFGVTRKYNLGWVLISLTMEIERPVRGSIDLTANTWHAGRKGPFFRREFVFNDQSGVLFKGCTYSVLLDLAQRKVFSGRDVPFLKISADDTYTVQAIPTFRHTVDFAEVERRKIYNSHIDYLGHVNNLRYSEFAYDALDDEERKRYSSLKRLELYFRSEMKLGDEFTLKKAVSPNEIVIKGEVNGEDSFFSVWKF